MQPTLFRNVNVFDGHSEALLPGANVLVVGGKIEAVSDVAIKAPTECVVVEGAGKTLLPGLIDAHVHIWATDLDFLQVVSRRTEYIAAFAFRSLKAMLERGFTTVRDAGGTDLAYALALQDGLQPGPRLLHAGRFMSQTGGHGDYRTPGAFDSACGCQHRAQGYSRVTAIVDGADSMRAAVREELRKGARQIKIMGSGGVASPAGRVDRLQFTDEEIGAAVDECARHGTYVMAHCHPAESIARCAELGVRSIEHASLITSAAAEIVKRHGAFVVPTLAVFWAFLDDGERLGLPTASVEKLAALSGGMMAGLDIMRTMGLRVGFGTDLLGAQQARQGTEFALRARVFSPIEILRQATSINAELLKMGGEIGCVRPGAIADLLLLEGDPLQDITCLGSSNNLLAIMQGGEFYKRLV